MASLTTVIHQCMSSFFKVHASSMQVPTLSDVVQLHKAVKADDPNSTLSLIQSGADVNVVYQQETALTRALDGRHFKAAQVIISSRQFDPNAKNQFYRSPLFMAAKVGHVEFLKRLLAMRARVNDADIRGNTPLSACAWEDNHESAEILLQHGANIDQSDTTGQTTLFRACSNVCVNVVKVLVRHNCDVDKANKEKKTPLMVALPSYYNFHIAGKKCSDMLQICELLIKSGCNVNSQDDKGKTSLHYAVESNDIHGTCLLAESGCDLNIPDNLGHTPFHAAILPKRCFYDIARYLLYYGADVSRKMQLQKDPKSLPVSPLSVVLNSRPGPTELDKKWERALLLKSLCRSVYPRPSLVENYEHANGSIDRSSSEKGDQQFHHALELEVMDWVNSCIPCSLQHQTILTVRKTLGSRNIFPKLNRLPVAPGLKQCLALGLHPDFMPLSKTCLLHLHISDLNNEKVQELIKSGTDLNMPINNKTPLTLAVEIGNIEAARMILGSYTQSQSFMDNASGDSVLHVVAKHGRNELMDEVLRVFPDLDCPNHNGLTALQVAIQAGHFSTAAVLINQGAGVVNDGADGVTLLHLAAASGAHDVVRLLLERGVDPNTEDKFGNTPLHVAASKGFQYLQLDIPLPALYDNVVSASLDTIQMTLTASTPKYTKATAGHASVIECLLQSGADPTRLNFQAQTPLQTAQHFKTKDLLDLLNDKQRAFSQK